MPILDGQTDFPVDAGGRHSWGMYDGSVLWLPRGDVANGLDVDVTRTPGGLVILRPTVTINATAYSAGNVVGGVITLTGAARVSGGSGVIREFSVSDAANQKAGLEILVFDSNPTGGVYGDHAAPTINATDITTRFLGRIKIDPADYQSVGAYAEATVQPQLDFKAVGSANLFLVPITPVSTPTYGATNALGFVANIWQD